MAEKNLTGKVALVTGAARRIGAAIVRTLHGAGATVVVHYRHSANDALALQAELLAIRPHSCYLVQADLLDVGQLPTVVEKTVAQAGRMDILVNNASSFYQTRLGEVTEQQWDDLLGTNLKAPLFLAQAAMSQLQAHQGVMVNLVDVHGVRPLPDFSVYCVAKAGLLMLTQVLARELGPRVRVNGIAPGAILWPEFEVSEAKRAELLAKTALRRAGEPDDIARAVLFLVRDATYTTGQILAVDGGRLLSH